MKKDFDFIYKCIMSSSTFDHTMCCGKLIDLFRKKYSDSGRMFDKMSFMLLGMNAVKWAQTINSEIKKRYS